MLNFKFIKFAFVFFIIIYFIIGHSPAFAKFVTVYPNQGEEDSNPNNNMIAAAADAIPPKTDGDIVNCFDYYGFPSAQTVFEPAKKNYEPGQTVYFRGKLINGNDYPIADGYLFVRIARFNENYTREGHDIVDEFFAQSGPQGREKFYLESKETKGVVFGWNAPENLPEGVYTVSFSFVVGKKMNLAGLSFTNEVVAGLTKFEIGKSATAAKRVFLEKSSFAVNGKKYNHIGLWPRFEKGAKVEVSGRLKNETLRKENIKLVYDLYYWDGLDDENKISSQSEDIIVAPGSSHSFKYIIPKIETGETVYFLRITAIAGNNQKSIVNLRFVSEQEKPRINFFSPMKFPVLAGETMTNFACFHNTADKSARGKMTMNVFDQSGDKIQTVSYEGEITGNIMAVKKETVVSKNYDYLRLVASITGADGRETDGYEMIYDCKNMNLGNEKCAKIQEEKAKIAADISSNLFDKFNKKDIAAGIIALAAILSVITLLRKIFMNKTRPPLTSLFFVLAVGSAVFLASGMGNYAWTAEQSPFTNPLAKDYNFPPGVNCDKAGEVQGGGIHVGPIWQGDPLWICVKGQLQIEHNVTKSTENNIADINEEIKFSYEPIAPPWYDDIKSGANDSPFGEWCGSLDDKSCLKYDKVGWVGANDQATIKDDIDMTWLAVKPVVYMTSSNDSIIACEKMTCIAKKQGKATLTANIGELTARPWIKLYAGKGWEGWGTGTDYKGDVKMHDIKFNDATLTWDFVVDADPPTCKASFSKPTINKGELTDFSWETTNDEDTVVPIFCDINDLGYYSGWTSGVWANLSPKKTQTCEATAVNTKGTVKCSATVTVSSVPPFFDEPSQPQNFTASAACQAVNLSWNKDNNGEYSSTNSGSEVVKYYEITRDGSYIVKKSDNINRSSWDNNSYTDSSATDSAKTYSYTIKACNDQDKCSAEAGPAIATPTAGPCKGTGTVTPTPDPGTVNPTPTPDPGTANLTLKKKGSGDGNVQLYGWRSAPLFTYDYNDYGDTIDSDFQNNKTKGLAKDWWFKMSATPSSGSYFSSWSGCTSTSEGKSWTDADGTVHYSTPSSGENACYMTMTGTGNKTATVTFDSSSGTGGGGGGGSTVKAYISAQNTEVSDGNSTVVTWTSDNATSCEQKEGGSGNYKDTGWISASDTALGSYTTATFTTSGGPRTYKVTCANGSQEADAEVTVNVGDGQGSPSITMWADPQSVGYKKTSVIQWLSSNVFPNSCLLYSAVDTMNGYLSYFNFPKNQYFGSGYYNSEIGENNLTGQKTGKLSGDTVYKIQCTGYGPSFAKTTAQTTVIVAKPVSNFTLTNPTGGSLIATIVEGLSANSNSISLSLRGEAIGDVSLSASIPAISGAKAQFSSDNGASWSDSLSVDISAISEVKIKVIKIPGAIPVGTYNTAITATDTGTGGKTKKLNVNLQINKVSSEWKEF